MTQGARCPRGITTEEGGAAVQVVALVGPAGTGKSHRAAMVADREGCRLIVDDGLIIDDGRILVGTSAKREPNRMAAVRRAIFHEPAAAAAARRVLEEIRPPRVLVLGTSSAMVERIVVALGLPHPERTIRIDEIASAYEMRQARRTRREEGKHVIPAPTLEVRKTFAGYFVDPLRFIAIGRHDRRRIVEKSVVRPTWSSLGHLQIDDTVLGAIATRVAEQVDAVAVARRPVVEILERGVTIRLDVETREGRAVLDVLRQVQSAVMAGVEAMASLSVLRVDVRARRLAPSEAAGDGEPVGGIAANLLGKIHDSSRSL